MADNYLPGTGINLHYASNRVKGYQEGILVPVSGNSVPSSLKKIIARVGLAGRSLEQTLDPMPNQRVKFIWDGMDFLGRPVRSPIIGHHRIF